MTSKITGKMATLKNVSEPAMASALAASFPAIMADSFALSYHLPMIGSISAVENIPAPPIKDKPNAPVLGRYSETNPSIVGQKKQIPTANTAAAPKAAYPLDLLNRNNP